MKNKIISLRGFLERNKIFFEIITATSLTIASIFVAIKANNIATYANGISQEQTSIMRSENTPRIQIKRNEILDSTKTNYITKWSIYNNNSKISNFEIEKEVSYLVVEKGDNKIDIPIVKYLDSFGKISSQNEGLIYEFDNKHCYEYEYLTSQVLSNHSSISIKSFIEVSHYDVAGDKKKQFFQITPLIEEIFIPEWKSLEDDWRSKNNIAISLEHVEKNVTQIKKIMK